MSRNRVRHQQSLQSGAVLWWVVAVGLVASLGVCYMVLQNRIIRVAEETRRQEQELVAWKERNAQMQLAIQRLRAPRELQRRIDGMGMVKLTELEWVPMDVETSTRLAKGTRIEGRMP